MYHVNASEALLAITVFSHNLTLDAYFACFCTMFVILRLQHLIIAGDVTPTEESSSRLDI
jgi:hypothetical protein